MKYIIPAILCAFLVATFTFAQGTGTINQLDQWRRTVTGQITQNIANSTIKLTGYESSGDCLVTDIDGVVSTSSCGTGGGGGASSTIIKINGTVSNTGVPTIDFGSGITVTESPTDEFNLSVPIYLATSSTWTTGNLARVASNGAVDSLATSALAIALSDTTGTLGPTRGGTNQTTYSTGDMLYASAANTLSKLAIGATGQVLMVSGGVPSWVATSSLGITGGSNTVYLASSTGGYSTGNLAYVSGAGTIGGVATGTLTETVSGLQLDQTRALVGGSAVLSLSSGYEIPLSASTTQWTQAYASTTALTNSYIRGLFSASSPITYNNATGAFTFSTAGDWTGTFDGIEGSAYLSRANHTGTQLASTISDFATQVQALSLGTTSAPTTGQVAFFTGARTLGSTATGTLTETATGLSLSGSPVVLGGSSVLTIDSGFTLASTTGLTNLYSFYDTPSTRITAGDGLTWSGNTLDFDGGNTPGGELGGTWSSPTLNDGVSVSNWNLTSPTLTSFFSAACASGEAIQDIGDTGNFTCIAVGGSGGGGGSLSTTTDIVGDGAAATVSYVTTDVMFGGSASTTAEFQFDKDGSKFIISSSSDSASTTIANTNSSNAIQFGIASSTQYASPLSRGIQWFFRSSTDVVLNVVGSVTNLVVQMNFYLASGFNFFVGSTQWNNGNFIEGAAIASSTINAASLKAGTATAGYLLTASSTASGGMAWASAAISLTSQVSGVLPIANGGTGTSTPTLLYKPSAIQVTSGASAITTGDGKAYFRIPKEYNGMNLIDVDVAVTASSTSGYIEVQLARGRQSSAGVPHTFSDMLSTRVTIDQNEYDSQYSATTTVINTSNDDVIEGDLIRIDVDKVGSGPSAVLIIQPVFGLP